MATLAVGTPGSVDLRDATSGAIVRTIAAHQGEVTDLAFSPDGHWLATAGADGVLRVWDVQRTGAVGGRRGAGRRPGLRGRGSPRGCGLAGRDGRAARRDVERARALATRGTLVETSADGDGAAASPLADDDLPVPQIVGLSPDGRQVAVGAGDLWIFDTETGQTASIPCPSHTARGPSPGARTGVSSRRQGWAGRATGTPRRVSRDRDLGHASGFVLAWSPDSRRLATDAPDVIVWDHGGRPLDGVPHPRRGGDESRRGQPRLLTGGRRAWRRAQPMARRSRSGT